MTKEWEPKHEKVMAEAVKKLANFEAEHPTPFGIDLVM